MFLLLRRPEVTLLLLASVSAPGQEEHWSLRAISRPQPPAVADGWVRTPIDRFILARLERAGLRPSRRADHATLARRIALVMHGLTPSPEEVGAFVADRSGDAWDRLVDRSLASPHYGERWGRHWLDVVRFAETNGFETNTPRPNAWPYRDWVIRAFNEDLPWDRFVTAQLAGDTLGDDAATGFLVAGPYDTVKSPDPVLTATQRQDELADMVNVVSTSFLGLTVACARCHDHKLDPITQKDFYAVQATLAGVQHGDRPLRERDGAVRARLEELERHVKDLRTRLDRLPRRPPIERRATIIDDEVAGSVPGVTILTPKAGHGINPAGGARGHREDRGDLARAPNVSSGRYTWWQGRPRADLIAYHPGVTGRYRVWISWGAGWHTHAKDTQYVLRTGERETMLATIDQRRFADGTLDITDKPLWSGLKDVGVHPLTPGSRIIVRSGSTARPTTADVVVIAPADSTWHPVRHLRDPVNASGNVERFPPVVAHAVRFTSLATNSKREPCIDELEVWTAIEGAAPSENVALATAGARCSSSGNYANDPKHRLEHVNDGRYGNPRSWISNTLARGWVRIDFKAAARIDTIKWARDRQRRYADRLATSYVIGALVGERWVRVASSADRVPFGVDGDGAPMLRLGHLDRTITGSGAGLIEELRVVEAELAGLRRRPQVYAGRFVEPPRTRLLYRGDPAEPRGDVAPDVPAVLGTLALAPASRDRDRRHALAGAITDPRNPLTARVVVNRIWLHHFGEGLVDTPNDLGRMGTAPTHPELLDWLAAELMDHAWSVKHIQKLILSSAVWMQASAPRPEGDSVDASTRLLWRFPPRRLESEAIRDGMLRVSGELDLTMGGPGFDLFEPSANYVRVYEPRKAFGKDGLRRMVYARVVRMERDGTFGAFDTPDAGQVCPKRTRSTTALQALNLLNAPFVLKRADAFANRLRRERGDDVATQVRHAFALAFSRAPDQKELDESVGLVTNHGLSAFCRALLNTSEFLFIP